MSVAARAGALFSHTVEWDKEANGTLRDPLADSVTGALLYAGDQGGVIDYAVEYLALWRFGRAHGGGVGTGPRWVRAAAHDDWGVRGTSECCKRVAVVIVRLRICRVSRFAGRWDLRTVVGRLVEGKCGLDERLDKHLCSLKVSRRVHCARTGESQRSE